MHVQHHGMGAVRALVQLCYHVLALVALVCLLVGRLLQVGYARLESRSRAKSTALATAKDAPHRVMHLHIHLGEREK